MADKGIESQVKHLVEERKYEEAKELLISNYNLSDEQAVEFIQRLEQSSAAKSEKIKPGLAKRLSKGCGCLTIFFLAYFVFGVYSMFSGSDNGVPVTGKIEGYVVEEYRDNDARLLDTTSPIISYTFDGKDYIDTASYFLDDIEYPVGSDIDISVDPNFPDYTYIPATWGEKLGWYIPVLFFAFISFMAWRFLRRFKFNWRTSEIAQKIEEVKKMEMERREQAAASEAAGKPIPDPPRVDPKTGKPVKEMPLIWVVILAAVFTGLTAFLITLQMDRKEQGDTLSQGEVIAGTVISERRQDNGDSPDTYHYRIEYEFNNAVGIYETATDWDDYNSGDKVQLRINPNDPQQIAIDRLDDIYGPSYMMWIIISGALALLFGYSAFYTIRKRAKHS